jgi:Arabinose efflux permease
MRKIDAAILLLKNFSSGLTVPVLSMILMNKGCTLAQLAVAVGAYSLTAVALELPTGIFADRFGRKNCFLVSMLIGCGSNLFLLISQGLPTAVLSMALSGASRAFGSGSMDALLIDRELQQNGEEGLPKVSTQLSLLETGGVAAGSVAGGALCSLLQNLVPQHPYDAVLLLRVVLGLATAALAFRFTEEAPPRQEHQPSLKQYLRDGSLLVGKSPTVLLLTAGGLCTGFFISTVEVYWQPEFTALLPEKSLSWLLGILSFGCMAFASLGSVAMRRVLHTRKAAGLSGYNITRPAIGVCLLLLALAANVGTFGVWYFALYFVYGAANIAESVLLNLEIPNEYRAGMLSFFSLVVQAGNLLSTVVGGAVVALRGVPTLWFWGAIVLILLSSGIGVLLFRVKKRTVGE